MASKQTTQENVIVYDLDEIARNTEGITITSGPEVSFQPPEQIAAQIVRLALRETVMPLFEGNPDRFPFVDTCLGELVQDVYRHGGEGLKKVKVLREIGGVAIETENGIKERDALITGLGSGILKRVFKQNFSAGEEDGIYRARVFIPDDPIAQQVLDVRLAS